MINTVCCEDQRMSPSPSSQLSTLHPVMARCSSYTTIVHQEKEGELSVPGGTTSLTRLIQTSVEWLVILQRLEEERKTDVPAVSCRCSKAVRINEELKNLGRSLTDICQVEERLGQLGSPQLEDASQLMAKVSGLLRADVSILIPSHVGRAEPSVSLQAHNIVNEADCPRLVVDETMECVAKLVYKLLSVETCALCRPGSDKMDIDPDIMSMVATMCGDYSNMDDDTDTENRSPVNNQIGKEILEKSRKRKQNRPQKFQTPLLPHTSRSLLSSYNQESLSPTKKIRKLEEEEEEDREERNAREVLFLLEKKKKGPKSDGLYKFVLWREALKNEKNKICLSS